MPYNDRQYFSKLQELDILPIDYYFLKVDLLLFYKIIHELVPIKLPVDIIACNPQTRSRHIVRGQIGDFGRNREIICNMQIASPKPP